MIRSQLSKINSPGLDFLGLLLYIDRVNRGFYGYEQGLPEPDTNCKTVDRYV